MYKEIVEKLKQKNLTIATMESCTGGAIVNEITNIEAYLRTVFKNHKK